MHVQKTTPYLDDLIKKSKKIKRQFIFSKKEKVLKSDDIDDPLCDEKFKVTKFLIHHYKTKVLFLTSPNCFANCRHCFRKNILEPQLLPTHDDFIEAAEYVKSNTAVTEILLSGGDPLVCSNEVIKELLSCFSKEKIGRDINFRICTRVPIVFPERIDDNLLQILTQYKCRFSVHINCCDELTNESTFALKKILDSKIEILTQTVLLKGVNDSFYELKKLFKKFIELNLTPYYLFQGDPAKGTACFRVPIKRGVNIYKKLLKLKINIPIYAKDLPNGGGKVKIIDESNFSILNR